MPASALPAGRLAVAALLAAPLAAQAPASPTPRPSNPAPGAKTDPVLQALIAEAMDRNPALARDHVLVEAERERVPQARALPDPTVSLGLQNDGFKRLEVGRMETSYYQLMVSQGLPWPGKRGLRADVAALGAEASRWTLERTRLDLVADVTRAYVGLLLARDQLGLLERQVLIWKRAAETAQVRYEVGQGSQADLLRAQLELSRLAQGRIALRSLERQRLEELNHLRHQPVGSPLETSLRLDATLPEVLPAAAWIARADEESPEVQAARTRLQQAERSLDLARRDRYPDFAVNAGVMPRGGLDPMWTVGVSVSVPLWSKSKQQRAVSEQDLRRRASGAEEVFTRHHLQHRIEERAALQEAVQETLRLYRGGLLVQSEAAFQASLAQYEAGRLPFLSVLEALNGWVADQSAYLQAVEQAWSLAIAQAAFSLDAPAGIGAGSGGTSPMGMGGGKASTPAASMPSSSARPGASDTTPAMKSM